MGFEILRIEKLKNIGDVVRSGKHTFREQFTPNADPDKPCPQVVEGFASDSDSLVRAVYSCLGQVDKKDKQAVPCIEYLVTASKETMKEIDSTAYLDDALRWIKAKHGVRNVVCAVIHHDEDAPHLVAYVVPVVEVAEKTRKRSVNVKGCQFGRQIIEEVVPAHSLLSASAFFGGRNKLSDLQTEFHEAVGVKHGLERGVSKAVSRKHIKTSAWYAEQQSALDKRLNEIEGLRADLDKDLLKLAEERIFLAAQHSRMAAELRNRGLELDKDRDHLAAVKIKLDAREADLNSRESGLFDRGVVLDQREDAMNRLEAERATQIAATEDSLRQREVALDNRKSTLDGYKDALNADIVAFKIDRAEYHKQWLNKVKTAPSEEEKKKAAQELVTPVRKGQSR